jgi:hypothetical protein
MLSKGNEAKAPDTGSLLTRFSPPRLRWLGSKPSPYRSRRHQRIREMVAEDAPKRELTVGLERHPKKLRRVGGKISPPIDADDPKWTHLFIEPREIKFPQRDARADLLFCRREFTNGDASASFLIFENV